MLQQHRENLKWLLLKSDSYTLLAKLACLQLKLEHTKTQNRGCLRFRGHAGSILMIGDEFSTTLKKSGTEAIKDRTQWIEKTTVTRRERIKGESRRYPLSFF